MTTKTFHDIYDLVEMVSHSKNAQIEISMQDGRMHFSVTNFVEDSGVYKSEPLKIDGESSLICAYFENVDAAFRAVQEKLSSGEWEKADDCA